MLAAALTPGFVWAHGGVPALATFPFSPPCVRVSEEVALQWVEPDVPSSFGTSMVELSVTQTSTRPLYSRERPLAPWTRIHRVLDADPANRFVWRTSTVAQGHYFLWSYIEEPPQENADFVAHQAQFVITVERERPQGPTVMLRRPASFSSAIGRYQLEYTACDPSGTARVRLEAAPERAPDDYRVLADNLPAVVDGTYVWDTRGYAQERWIVRARIYDECGFVFESHARAFVEVRPPLDPYDGGTDDAQAAEPIDARSDGGSACAPRLDATGNDSGPRPSDAGPRPDAVDGGCVDCVPVDEGCGCVAAGRDTAPSAVMALVVLGLLGRRRQRG